MKEQRFFYTTAPESGELPKDEAQHALRVLRLQMGDEISLMDGCGTFYNAIITEGDNHHCRYRITERLPQQSEWQGTIHLAVAPTKNMDRIEWLAEKATEIGIDRLSLLDCRFSERHVVKTERLSKIIVSAVKQSRKAWIPQLDEMTPFRKFITRDDLPAQRFIAHCYNMESPDSQDSPPAPDSPPALPVREGAITFKNRKADACSEHSAPSLTGRAGGESSGGESSGGESPHLLDLLIPRTPALVLIGPEGDFSIDEVREAEAAGFRSISLGTSRLRTETAALVAVHLMRLANR